MNAPRPDTLIGRFYRAGFRAAGALSTKLRGFSGVAILA
jgi:hypothetical protein